MNSSDIEKWAAIKADYLAGDLTVPEIVKKHGRSRTAIYEHAAREGWAKRRPIVKNGRSGLINRLTVLLERQLKFLEKNMTGTDDKEVALLGTMVRTLEKLIDLERKDEAAAEEPQQDQQMSDLREKLAARIDQLRQS